MFHLKDAFIAIGKQIMLAERHDTTFKPCSLIMESKNLTSVAPILHLIQAEQAKEHLRFCSRRGTAFNRS